GTMLKIGVALSRWWLSPIAVAIELQCEPQQGALLLGKVQPGSSLRLDGDEVAVTAAGDFVIGFDREAEPRAQVVVSRPDGSSERETVEVARRDYRIQRIEGVPQRTVTPPPEALERIRQEAALVRAARASGM